MGGGYGTKNVGRMEGGWGVYGDEIGGGGEGGQLLFLSKRRVIRILHR